MPTAELLESIRSRTTRSGIVTADRYFREVEGCFDGGFCPVDNVGAKSEDEWRKSLKEAEQRLTYTAGGMRVVKRSVQKAPAGEGILQFDCIVTTPRKDHDGDILMTKGAKLNKSAPLLWQHMHMMPIGKLVKQIKQDEQSLRARFVIADTAIGRDAATLVKLGALRISHGFEPVEWEPLEEDEDGYLIKVFNIFEVSLVSLPSNEDAVITELASKSFDSALVRGWQKSVTGCRCKGHVSVPAEITAVEPDKRVIKDFDVERQHVEAAKLEYDWISRFCSCEVKQLVNHGTHSPRIKMGSFLTGMKHALADSLEIDGRRLTGAGLETPLEYETIQLNSKLSDHFLIDGISFRKLHDGTCFAVKFVRTWTGESVEVFSSRKDHDKVCGILGDAWKWADDNNFLKGEAFSLLGEFLPKTSETWGDLFLDPVNEREVKRSVELLNAKGKEAPNRGQVFMGPPGTGKTLAGRLLRNHADAAFIWVAGKDSYYFGGTDAIIMAYDLAKELAPAIIFMEDIDATFTYERPIDVLKGEMDGIGRSSGIVTVITTNNPSQFPEALLDRPGRFHDVLKFDLPDDSIRKDMLAKWLPEQSEKSRLSAVQETKGYSGAHLYELCQYAKSLRESDELEIDAAVTKALKKIADQRDLIDQALMRDRTLAGRRREADPPCIKGREITKSFVDDGTILRDRPFQVIQREYLAALAKSDIDALRRSGQVVSLMVRAAEQQQEAREWDDVLSHFTNRPATAGST